MKKAEGRLHALKIPLEESPTPSCNGLSIPTLFSFLFIISFIQSCVHHACMVVRFSIFNFNHSIPILPQKGVKEDQTLEVSPIHVLF